MKCECCGGSTGGQVIKGLLVDVCARCGSLNSETLEIRDTYDLVKSEFSKVEVPLEDCKYFDFTNGTTRRHGWFDPKTGLITQIG